MSWATSGHVPRHNTQARFVRTIGRRTQAEPVGPAKDLLMPAYEERIHLGDEQLQLWSERYAQDLDSASSARDVELLASFTKVANKMSKYSSRSHLLLRMMSEEARYAALRSIAPKHLRFQGISAIAELFLIPFGTRALEHLDAYLAACPTACIRSSAMCIESPRLAVRMAITLAGDNHRDLAQEWLGTYPKAALTGLVHGIATLRGRRLKAALAATRFLCEDGHRATMQQVLKSFDASVWTHVDEALA